MQDTWWDALKAGSTFSSRKPLAIRSEEIAAIEEAVRGCWRDGQQAPILMGRF